MTVLFKCSRLRVLFRSLHEVNVGQEVLDKHYDKRDEVVKVEQGSI